MSTHGRGGDVADVMVGKLLTKVEVAADGSCVRLGMTGTDGRPAALELPLECVNQLIMTLPRVFNSALRMRYRDSSMRLVFPLTDWRLERAAGDRCLILTLQTEGGFEVAFTLEVAEIERMQETAGAAPPARTGLN